MTDKNYEAGYRAGYVDGWVILTNILSDLEDRATGRTMKAVADAAFDHWQGPLRQWSRSDGSRVEAPTLTLTTIKEKAKV